LPIYEKGEVRGDGIELTVQPAVGRENGVSAERLVRAVLADVQHATGKIRLTGHVHQIARDAVWIDLDFQHRASIEGEITRNRQRADTVARRQRAACTNGCRADGADAA